jgi:hypothetical protein
MNKNVMPLNDLHLAMIRQALGDIGFTICNSIMALNDTCVAQAKELEELKKTIESSDENA